MHFCTIRIIKWCLIFVTNQFVGWNINRIKHDIFLRIYYRTFAPGKATLGYHKSAYKRNCMYDFSLVYTFSVARQRLAGSSLLLLTRCCGDSGMNKMTRGRGTRWSNGAVSSRSVRCTRNCGTFCCDTHTPTRTNLQYSYRQYNIEHCVIYIYCAKKSPLKFSDIFPETVGNF